MASWVTCPPQVGPDVVEVDVVRRGVGRLGQGVLHVVLDVGALGRRLRVEVDGDLDLAVVVELVGQLDHGRLGDPGRLRRRGGLGHGEGLRGDQPRLPALEVDALVEAAGAEGDDAEEDDEGRDAEPPLAVADEIERGLAPVEADEARCGASRRAPHAPAPRPRTRSPRRTPRRARGPPLPPRAAPPRAARRGRWPRPPASPPAVAAVGAPAVHGVAPAVTPRPLATLMPRTSLPLRLRPRRMTKGRVKK